MPELDRARLDVLAYFLHDDRDLDGGAKAIDDLSFPRLVAIVDAVIRGLITDPSVAYALAWADAGGTVPDLGATASREAIPAADAERELRINAGLDNRPPVITANDLARLVELAEDYVGDHGTDDERAFLTHWRDTTADLVNAGAGDWNGLIGTSKPTPDPNAIVLHHDDVLMAGRWIEGRLLAEAGRLGAGYDIGAVTGTRLSGILLGSVGRALTIDTDTIGELDDEADARTLATVDDYRTLVDAALTRLAEDLRDRKLINLAVTLDADVTVTIDGGTKDSVRIEVHRDVDRGVDRGVGSIAIGDGMAEHATPEVRADDAIDPVAVVTEAARWVRARLSSSAGIYDQGTYDANSGIKAAENLDRLAALMTASRPATVDDVHRLAEAGGKLAKAADLMLSRLTVRQDPDAPGGAFIVLGDGAETALRQARESWGHAARGVYAVPHPKFVEKARGVAIAAGELGSYVDHVLRTGGLDDRVADVDPEVLTRQADTLGNALAAFDEVDTAYQRDRDEHARRIRLSD